MSARASREIAMPPARDDSQCAAHADLARNIGEIKDDLRDIKRCLGDGKVTFATLALRVSFLERVVWGALGVAGTALVMSIWNLLLKGG
jgi:hypothetical protein